MTVIATIRQALSDACATISGLDSVPTASDQVNVLQAVVWREQIDYDLVMGRAADTYNFKITVYGIRSDPVGTQTSFDNLCEPTGATSLKATLETASVAAAAAVDYVRVKTAHPVTQTEVGGLIYLTQEFDVEVVV